MSTRDASVWELCDSVSILDELWGSHRFIFPHAHVTAEVSSIFSARANLR